MTNNYFMLNMDLTEIDYFILLKYGNLFIK